MYQRNEIVNNFTKFSNTVQNLAKRISQFLGIV